MNGVFTSLLAIEIPLTLFPGSSHPAHTPIPPFANADSRVKLGFPGRAKLRMLFAWISTLDSEFPVEGLLKYPPLEPPSRCTGPVIVLPSMERLSISLLAFPQHAAMATTPKPTAPSMVFERTPIFRAMLFSEYWIGLRDGNWSSLAASPLTTQMPDGCWDDEGTWPVTWIWLAIICTPSTRFADPAAPPDEMRIPGPGESDEMVLFAIKVSRAWLFLTPSPPPTFIPIPVAPGIGSTMLLLAIMVCCNVSPTASSIWNMIPSCGPETAPVMVLPVITTWSQVFPVGGAPAVPQNGQKKIPAFWMFVITRLLMVMLEKVLPVAVGSPAPIRTPYGKFWKASPLRVMPPELTFKAAYIPERLASVISGCPRSEEHTSELQSP